MNIIHIGSPKTGTTSIQHFLDKTKVDLFEYGLNIPSPGWSSGGHSDLRSSLSRLSSLRETILNQKVISANRIHELVNIKKDFKSLLLVPPTPHMLLSTECFWTVRPKRLLKVFPALTKQPCRIICSLRDPISFAQSHYTQKLKAGKTNEPFQKWIKQNKYLYHYASILKPWHELFGRENVICFSYEEACKNGLISTFMYLLSSLTHIPKAKMDHLLNKHSEIAKQHSNKSPLNHILGIIFEINKMKSSSPIKNRLRKAVLLNRHKLSAHASIKLDLAVPHTIKKYLISENRDFLRNHLIDLNKKNSGGKDSNITR